MARPLGRRRRPTGATTRVSADCRDGADHADAGGHRRELVLGLRQSRKKGSRYRIGLDPKQGQRSGRALRGRAGDQLDAGGEITPAPGQPELVGLLRPGQGGAAWASGARGRWAAHPEALRRPLALGLGHFERRVADTNPGDDQGTSVRAACASCAPGPRAVEGLLRRAHLQAARQGGAAAGEGITANRWAAHRRPGARRAQEPRQRRRRSRAHPQLVGARHPHRVWMPDETLQRLIDEDGEVALITDR